MLTKMDEQHLVSGNTFILLSISVRPKRELKGIHHYLIRELELEDIKAYKSYLWMHKDIFKFIVSKTRMLHENYLPSCCLLFKKQRIIFYQIKSPVKKDFLSKKYFIKYGILYRKIFHQISFLKDLCRRNFIV